MKAAGCGPGGTERLCKATFFPERRRCRRPPTFLPPLLASSACFTPVEVQPACTNWRGGAGRAAQRALGRLSSGGWKEFGGPARVPMCAADACQLSMHLHADAAASGAGRQRPGLGGGEGGARHGGWVSAAGGGQRFAAGCVAFFGVPADSSAVVVLRKCRCCRCRILPVAIAGLPCTH